MFLGVVCCVAIFVLSVLRVVGSVPFMGSVCVSSCRCYVLVSIVQPVAILSAVFCVICTGQVGLGVGSGCYLQFVDVCV